MKMKRGDIDATSVLGKLVDKIYLPVPGLPGAWIKDIWSPVSNLGLQCTNGCNDHWRWNVYAKKKSTSSASGWFCGIVQ